MSLWGKSCWKGVRPEGMRIYRAYRFCNEVTGRYVV